MGNQDSKETESSPNQDQPNNPPTTTTTTNNTNQPPSSSSSLSKPALNIAVTINNHLNTSDQTKPTKTVELSDEATKYQHYLKFLYKNNYTSLSYQDLCAFILQYHWRRHFIHKIKQEQHGTIDIIYTSTTDNASTRSFQDKTFDILDTKRYKYRCYDINKYTALTRIISETHSHEQLPAIFINGYYIGGYTALYELESSQLTQRIINKEYTERCIRCFALRDSNTNICEHCKRSYMFFVRNSNSNNNNNNDQQCYAVFERRFTG
jgi:glutaredoxin